MQRFRNKVRPCDRKRMSRCGWALARRNDAVTGGAFDTLDWQLPKSSATRASEHTRKMVMSERESEDGSNLEIRFIAGAGHLPQGRERRPPGSSPDRDIRAGEEFPALGFRPVRESNFVSEFCAEEQARVDLVA